MSKFWIHRSFRIRPGVSIALFVCCVALSFSTACNNAAAPQPIAGPSIPSGPADKQAFLKSSQRSIRDAMDVPISRLEGGSFKLGDFKGKVLLVDFWATYCPPCVRQAPQLAELNKRYRDRGLEVIGLTSDEKSDHQKVVDFMNRVGINYTIGYANNWVSGAFLKGTEDNTGAPPIPQLFIISRDGNVVEHLIGDSPEHGLPYLEKIVNRELALSQAMH